MTRCLALAALLVAGASDAAPASYPTSLLDNRVAGAPVDCIERLDTDAVHVGPGGIVYEMKFGGIFYYNRPTAGASFLHQGVVLLVDSAHPQLCHGDIVRTVNDNSRAPLAAVTLGAFTPYRRP